MFSLQSILINISASNIIWKVIHLLAHLALPVLCITLSSLIGIKPLKWSNLLILTSNSLWLLSYQNSALTEPLQGGSMQLSSTDIWQGAMSIFTWIKLNGTQIIDFCQGNQRQHLKYSKFQRGLTGSERAKQNCMLLMLFWTKITQPQCSLIIPLSPRASQVAQCDLLPVCLLYLCRCLLARFHILSRG